MPTSEAVREALKEVQDPELHLGIVDLAEVKADVPHQRSRREALDAAGGDGSKRRPSLWRDIAHQRFRECMCVRRVAAECAAFDLADVAACDRLCIRLRCEWPDLQLRGPEQRQPQ